MPPQPEDVAQGGAAGYLIAATVEMAARFDDDTIPLMAAPAPTTPNRMSLRASNRAATRWPIEEWLERENSKYPIPRSRVRELVDFAALNYPEDVDDNLLCPICKMPFVAPVTTPCDHTFCFDCIKQSAETSEVCPVDRKTFRPRLVKPASRLLRNLLDGLAVECPNTERGCTEKPKREDVVMHAHKCDYALISCPDSDCDKLVVRWLAAKNECLHHQAACPHCDTQLEVASMHEHVEKTCPKNQTNCEACGEPVRKSDLADHRDSHCPEADAPCSYAEYGCKHQARRKELADHHDACPYKVCAVIGQTMKQQEREIQRLKRENEERDNQIWALKQERQQGVSWDDFRPNPYGPQIHSAEEAVMGIYEEVERRIEGVKKDLTDLEGRQTVMILNETMPLKNEITEIRSNMGILKMHVAWLMNKSREEVERNRLASRAVNTASATVAAAAAAPAGASTARGRQGSASGDSLPRRLSDGSNGIPRL